MKKIILLIGLVFFVGIQIKAQGGGANDASFNVYNDGVNPNGGLVGYTYGSLDIQPDGKILIGGQACDKYNNVTIDGIARANPDGSIDAGFNLSGGYNFSSSFILNQIIALPDGRILLCGGDLSLNGQRKILRFFSDGTPDLNFNNNVSSSLASISGDVEVTSMAVQPDGKIIFAGVFSIYGSHNASGIFRINNDGSADQSFNIGSGVVGSVVSRIALQSNGKIFISSPNSFLYNGVDVPAAALLNSDGTLDVNFKNSVLEGSAGIKGMATLPDGKILVFGRPGFYNRNGIVRNGIVRLNADYSLDQTFNFIGQSLPDEGINNVVVQPNGKILVFGTISAGKHIARINSNGSLDQSFDSGLDFGFSSSFPRHEFDARIVEDNKMIVGGQFLSYNGIIRTKIARIYLGSESPCSANTLSTANGCSSNPLVGSISPTSSTSPMNCNNVNNPGVWYKLTATNANHIIRVTGVGDFKPSITMHTGSSCNAVSDNYLICASAGISGSVAELTATGLSVGTDYYLRVSQQDNTNPVSVEFSICVTTPPLNDEPCTAIEITPAATGQSACTIPVTGDVSNASFNPAINVCNVNTNDLWYSFTATRTSHIIKAIGNGDFQPAITAYSASSCSSFNAGTLGCAGYSTEVSLPLSGLTPGTIYYIRVCSSIYLTPANTSFSICVLTPDNDEPCTATLLTPGSAGVTTCTNPVQGNVSMATNSGLATNTNLSGLVFYNNDLWYKFVATQSTCLIRVDHDGDFRSAVNLYSSNDCNNIGARLQNDEGVSTLHVARYTGLIAGNTYYIQVSRRDTANNSTTFSICLLTPALNDEICGAIDLPNSQPLSVNCSNAQTGAWSFGTNSGNACIFSTFADFWYKFTATHTTHVIKTSNVADMAVYQASSCNGPLNLITCRGDGFTIAQQKAVPLNNLVIGNTYYVVIGKSTYVTNNIFSICQAAVPNDDPCGAVSLSNCSVIPVDVAFGTNTLSSTCQSVTPRDTIIYGTPQQVYDQIRLNDLWYTFTATETYGELILSGPALSGLFRLYLTLGLATFGDCSNLNTINVIRDCVQSFNFTNQSQGQIRIPFHGLTIGQTYYIAISNGNRDFTGVVSSDFNMEFRQGQSSVIVTVDPPGPVCLGTPVTFTATTNNGGSSPQLNWFVNSIPSGTGTTFSSATLQNNDVVTCALTSSNCVAPPTVSQSVTMDIYPVPTWYQDADGDGFGGVNAISTTTCVQPAGYVNNNTDCNDTNPAVFPGSVNPRPFRSRQNGNWGSSLTWEFFDGCNWIAGGIPSATDSTITINHEVTVVGGTTVNANEIVIQSGSLTINGKLNFVDGPGHELVSQPGSLIVTNEGSSLSGNGTVNNQGQAFVNAVGVIGVAFINNGECYFTRYTQGCCPSALINLSDGVTTGRIDNHGTFYIFASGGISLMNITNGEFYNHPGGTIHMEYKTAFNVNKFTNEGEFFLGGNPTSEYICTVNSTQGATHRGRIRSGDNNKKFVMQTNGTFTYAADCEIDANMHYATGIHEILSTSFGVFDTRVSTTVNCVGAEKNFPGNVYVEAGDFGGAAIKKIGGTIFWWAGTVSGGNLVINDTATAQLGAGQASLGTLSTTLVNNGTVNVFNAHPGCCSEPNLAMTSGRIENNGQFIFSPISGGIRNVTLGGGTFNNNASGTLVNNATLVSSSGDNEMYLRNEVFTNNGTILANGKSLNIFPTTDPVINGTITIASGGQVKFGIPSTTTTISSNAVINGAGTVYFFEGNHQVNTASYQVGGTSIGQTFSAANVYFNTPSVALNYVYMTSGVLGGAATKLIKDDMVFISGQITGGPVSNTDTSVLHYGAGNTNLGAMNTAFTNNGVVEVSPFHPGCCSEPVINLTGGSITNNGTFNVTGSGGIRYVGISNGTFTNNAGAVINSNVGDVAFGEPSFRMQPASFTNNGTINVLRNIMELGNFTVGGVINVSTNTVLRSTGTITFNGSLINNNGNITAPFDFINAVAKTLKGNGTFSSNIVLNNAATVAPGSSPGILTVAGNYTQGDAALNIEIGGINPGTGYDRLAVTGTATIGGTLNATELPGFDAQGVVTLDIITAGSVTGTFSQENLPPLWSVHYAANKVSLVKFFQFVYCRDADNDGFGNPADTIRRVETTAPAGYTADSTDCNDSNAAVNPAATEICDGIDNDCDGNTDVIVTNGIVCGMATSEGQSFTLTAPPGKVFTSVDFASYGTPNGTCGNFTIGSCHASSTMAIVQGLVIGQNSVTLTQNYQIFGDPCVGVVKRFYVQARYTNFVPLAQTYYADADGDGFGNPAVSQVACSQPSGYVLNNTDCNDNSAAAYPGATEVCDGIDNDCDGQIDVAILTTGLVAYYPFSGNANDAAGSLNGTVNGATLTTDRFGNANSAYSFDGVNDFIGLNGSFNGFNELTISAWYKMTAASPDLQAIVSSDQSGKFVHTQISSGGISNCAVYYDNNNALLLDIPSPALNQWVHMAIVAKSGNSKLYINGVEYSSSNASFSFISGSDLLRIGSGYLNGRFFNGSIDDIKMYNIALTPAQILEDFNTVPVQAVYYQDSDGDGFGNPLVTTTVSCGSPAPTGYVSNNTDCNDANANIYPNVTPGVINGANPILVTGTSVFTANGASGGTWSSLDPLIASVDPVSGLVTGVGPGSTTISYTIATCTGTASAAFNLTINPNITAGIVSGPPSLCIGATATFTSTGTPGGTWSSSNPAKATVDPATGLVTGISGGSVNIIYTVGGSQTAFASLFVLASPGTNLIISDQGFVFCIGETRGFRLALPFVTGVWSSSNTAVATVNPGTGRVTAIGGGIADIIFTQTNSCGQSTTSQPIRVIPASGSPVVTGPVNVCALVGTGTPVKYLATLPGIRLFNWTVPPNVTILSGQNTDTLTVTIASGFTTQANKQIICAPVLDRNCSNINLTSSIYILKSQLPGTPAPIAPSTTDICSIFTGNAPWLITYTIPKVPGAARYEWGFGPADPSHYSIFHPNGIGENDTTIILSFNVRLIGTLSVRAINDCGTSSIRSLAIEPREPAQPSAISGPSNICEHLAPGGVAATYTVPQQPTVTSYIWTVPAGSIGLTGQGTNSISFIFPANAVNATISVRAKNGCGVSNLPRNKVVFKFSPGSPSAIDVINTVTCPNRQYSYSLASMPSNATSVLWTVPSSGQIISGQGTSSITVSYPPTAVTGNVTATAVSNCGNSGTRSLTVKLPACPPSFASGNGNGSSKGIDVQENSVNSFLAEVFPNPAVTDFSIRISSMDKHTQATVRILDLQGRQMARLLVMPDELTKFGNRLSPGTYFMEVVQGGKRLVKKLIKQ